MSQELLAVIITGGISFITSILLFSLNRRANRKDSAVLSQTVESIKSDFQTINDKNRAKIELLFQSKRDMLFEQRKVIVEFWEEHFHLLRLCDTTRYEIDELRIRDFLQLKSQIESQQEKCEIICARSYFFFDQLELIDLCTKINSLCNTNSIKYLIFMDNIEPLLISAKDALANENFESYQNINLIIDEKSRLFDEFLDKNDPTELLLKFKKTSWSFLYH
jgi:hypothetical protein